MSNVRTTAEQKQYVAERARHCCEYCFSQVDYSPDPFSVDHIVPRALGGLDDLDNLAYACLGCNSKKSTADRATDPVTGEQVVLYHPRQHKWSEHFVWSKNCTLLIGLTPIGRATIERLQLNRKGVVNLRYLLSLMGKHPPQ